MGIERFEELIAWQKARELTKNIYQLSGKGSFSRDFGLAGQIQRVPGSVMSNLAEGYERKHPNEFYHFIMIAKSSCAEVQSHLYIALDIGYITQIEFEELMHQTKEAARIIGDC